MSAALPNLPKLPSSSSTPTLNSVTPMRTANPKLYSPISGVVGHGFIRLCVWVDRLSSWKKQSYAPPVDGFLNFADQVDTQAVPHSAAS
ncbi:MAG: hypothetical protein ACRD3P_13685 [Terriglobales bacterium]